MKMFLRRAVPLTLLTVGLATAAGAIGRGAEPAPQATDESGFPAGDSKKYVMDNCGGCHDLETVKNAKHDEAGWKETLVHMQAYGVTITDAQIPTVAAYLAKSFPVKPPATTPAPATPATPPAPAPGTPDAKKAEEADALGEKILNAACTTCHDLGPVTRRADDKAAWESVVYGMVGNGADVKEAEIPILVDYLVKHYGPPKAAAPATPATPAAPAAPAGRGGRGARGQ